MNEYSYGYLLTVEPRIDGSMVDAFLDTSRILACSSAEEYEGYVEADNLMGGSAQSLKQIGHTLSLMEMRARVNGHSVLYIRTEEEMTREDFDALLRDQLTAGLLEEFLQKYAYRPKGRPTRYTK